VSPLSVALLRAYFDESGTHKQYGRQVTIIAGFIGPGKEWRRVKNKWRAEMNCEVFHYKDMRVRGELLNRLAVILAKSKLQVVSGAFTGDWDRAISQGADWRIRYPSCYHFIFELCVEQMNKFSVTWWNNESIAVVFSRQNEYAKRAEEVWRTMKGNGFWQNIVSFTYGDPESFTELQAADMIVHETFQCMKAGTEEAFSKWPLVARLIAKSAPTLLGGFHNTETFVEVMKRVDREGRRYLKRV
jgi:hypothetical protein